MSEISGELVIPVRVLADENGITPEVGLPLGVRVTTRDGSAVGTTLLFSVICVHVHVNWKRYCLGCAVLLYLVVCMTVLASFFLPSPFINIFVSLTYLLLSRASSCFLAIQLAETFSTC